ncbi:rhodanese-like domain-containing protein [Demequina sp. TTPB684]|uniref:rhodanese-like domain-containing protein n=1 Tax=unclassified Demequina TaxID=2620311 RepID=UPI001CF140AE|nr:MULTISPECIES: rhodanese-like domain-containing protein [unclassified Demequina]MCB2413567.1 rhodanese-like domain-containing protein [Demequina sp. TTPB684]UPU87214.1 rhodanese-like domain-containing protein [Demequina sp. TMPB413]
MTTRTFRATILAAIAAVVLAACSSDSQEPPAFDGSHVDEGAFALAVEQPGVTVIDVRTPAEFAEGHLPGAVNMNVEDPAFATAVAGLESAADYAVYCRSGNRSRVAIDLMTQAGLTQTVGLEGGISAWRGEIVK